MSEHHTQGRQGQGSRRRYHKNNYNNRQSRRPRSPKEAPEPKKLTFLQRVLSFFGLRPKKKQLHEDDNRYTSPRQGQKSEKPYQTRNKAKRQSSDKSSVRERVPSHPPTRNARLHVGNLSYEATESELEELFKGFGAVRSVTVIYNRRTYKSKGYAFIEMCYLEDAQKAAEVLHGQPFMGRELMVSAADERHYEAEDKNQKDEGVSPRVRPEAESTEEVAEAAVLANNPSAI